MIDQLPANIQTMFLDMNGTFMFGHDRLGDEQNFYPAYVAEGGAGLAADSLNASVRRVIAALDDLYHAGTHDTNFPQVLDMAARVLGGEVSDDDIARVGRVIAAHEFGVLSDSNADMLVALAKRYRLYVVSNLWSPSARWRAYFDARLGGKIFSGLVFSSDIAANKPAPEIFEYALRMADANPADVVMVGDDAARDIRPAADMGMTTIWVSGERSHDGCTERVITEFGQLYSTKATL